MNFKGLISVFAAAVISITALSLNTSAASVNTYYDSAEELYCYEFSDGACFYSYDDLSVEEPVVSGLWLVSEDTDVQIEVYRDGELLEYSTMTIYEEAGEYSVKVSHILRNSDVDTIERVEYTVEVDPMYSDGADDRPENGSAGSEDGAADIPSDSTAADTPTHAEKVTEGRLQLEASGDSYISNFGLSDYIITDVLDGEVVGFMPKLQLTDGIVCSLYRNGEGYSLPQNGVIKEDGAYSATITYVDNNGNTEIRYYSFCVYKEPTNRLGYYYPPVGFSIDSVTLDGVPLNVGSDGFLMTDDGEYNIKYSNGTISRSVFVERDTVPPVISFNGSSDVEFYKAVTVTCDTPCEILVKRNGATYSKDKNTVLRGAGTYFVTATDEAGNSSTVRVEIVSPSAINPVMLFSILGAVVAACVIYIVVMKKRKLVVR